MSSSEPLYDRTGSVAAFILGRARIVTLRGQSVAWVRGDSIYDYTGRHLAWWEGDHVRDHTGALMYWLRGASTGLLHPIPKIPPIPGIPQIEQIRPIPAIPPMKPMRRLAWSAFRLPGT
jgi:hypothetical protein